MKTGILLLLLSAGAVYAADAPGVPSALNGLTDSTKGIVIADVGAPEPEKLQVPLRPVYVEQPVVLDRPNNGKYRPYIPSLDRVKAVFLAPWDPERDPGKGYGVMETDEIMAAINKTAAELSRMGVKAILVGNPGPDLRAAVNEIKRLGGKMENVETFAKRDYHLNHVWFRDYGLLPIKDTQTGRWDNVSMIIRGKPLTDLLAFAEQRFGLRTIDSLDVSETGGQLRGGNILMDEAGRCYSAGFRHPLYEATFKCTKTITFPCRSDVCHVDEYVTFLKNDTVVTNQAEFVPALRQAGVKKILQVPYDVHLSLANVLIVNDTVFMMYLDAVKGKMEQAKAVFEGEGYRVYPVDSGGAGRQYGAVHCLTKEIPQ